MIAPQIAFVVMVILAALLAGGYGLRRELLSIFGPVVFYDMVRLARRRRYFLMRLGYGCVLIVLLLIAYSTAYVGSYDEDSQRRDVLMAEVYFGQFMFVQLFAVSILVPAYVAGAIADEKERGTLEYILATPLSSFEIVVGKLASRVANLVLFVLVGLPILSFVQFLGGIDPNMLLAGFAATIATIFGLGGFSILCSVVLRKPRQATTVAFFAYLLYVFFGFVAYLMSSSGFMYYRLFNLENVPTLADVVGVCNAGNVLVGSLDVANAARGSSFYERLLELVLGYGLFHLVAGLIFTVLAVWRLRPAAKRHLHGEAPAKLARYLRRPDVSDRPILWKENHVERKLSWFSTVLTALLYVALAGFGAYFAIAEYLSGQLYERQSMMAVNMTTSFIATAMAFVLILGVAIRAARSIAGEREKDTLDGILVTPLDSDEILHGKLWGSILSRRHLAVMIGMTWVYGMVFGGMHVVDVAIMAGLLYLFARTWAQIGLWFSIGNKSSAQATMWTVVSYLGASFCCSLVSPLYNFMYVPTFSYQFRLGDDFRRHGPAPNELFGILMMVGLITINVAIYVVFAYLSWYYGIKPHFRRKTLRNERQPRRGPPFVGPQS